MDKIIFGPSGNGDAFWSQGFKSSVDAPKWLKSLGLDAYEYSFGRGFTCSLETANKIGFEAKRNNILMSVHAPFFVNLSNPDEMMAEKSYGYIRKSFDFLEAFGGEKVVCHLASMGKLARSEAISLCEKRLDDVVERLHLSGVRGYLCPETMGKPAQIGNWEEIIQLCNRDKILIPTYDFGHINALSQGGLKTEEDYRRIFDKSISILGFEKVKNCHIHFSKIEYGAKGEIRHLDFSDETYGPLFLPLAKTIREFSLTPSIICESASKMSEDALSMKQIFQSIS